MSPTGKKTLIKRHIKYHHTSERPHQPHLYNYKVIEMDTLKIHTMNRHTHEKPNKYPHNDFKHSSK